MVNGLGSVRLRPAPWQRTRTAADFDEQSIGLLAVPAPSPDDLGKQLRHLYGFLADLDELERAIIAAGSGSRTAVLDAIKSLDGGRYATRALY